MEPPRRFGVAAAACYETGDAYYAPPDTRPRSSPEPRVGEFHPTAELEQTMEVVGKNMEAAG